MLKRDPSKGGRPGYSDEERDEIIAYVLVQVATGRFVSRVFREDQTTDQGLKLPAVQQFWRWLVADDTGEYRTKLARAREDGIEALLDQCVDIADDGTNDFVPRMNSEGEEIGDYLTNFDVIQRSKLRIETRIKLAQMLKPKTYGPKLDLTSAGEKLSLAEAIEEAKRAQRERQENGEDG